MSGDPSLVLAKDSLFADRYRVVRCLSSGGMGAVYEALDQQTRRKRALKVMLPALVSDAGLRERFALEATVTADIESDHLVETFDAGVDRASGAPFIVMELLRGEDLAAHLERRARIPTGEVMTLMKAVATALQETHSRGIVHRDLKPENLFLNQKGNDAPKLKVLDFGIAKVVEASSSRAKTTKSVGTPLYMAPEQLKGVAISPKCDLYAVGHIAFTLLVGKPYYFEESEKGDGVYPVLTAAISGDVEPATVRAARLGFELPKTVDAWFAKATARDPAARFESAAAMVDALSAALGGVEAAPLARAHTDEDRLRVSTAETAVAPSSEGPISAAASSASGPESVQQVQTMSGVDAPAPIEGKKRLPVFIAAAMVLAAGAGAIAYFGPLRSANHTDAASMKSSATMPVVPSDTASQAAPAKTATVTPGDSPATPQFSSAAPSSATPEPHRAGALLGRPATSTPSPSARPAATHDPSLEY